MARVTGFTAERMQAIEDTCIVDGAVLLDNLILTQRDGSTIDAGNVRGPQGTAAAITGVSVVGLAAGAAPTVDAGGTPMARTFAFGIPKGDQGIQGVQGPSGTITSATASGLAAGAAPTIGLGGTPQARTLAFGIPQGADGAPGSLAMPAGTISLWGSDVAPANWMICDGSAISRTTYASLFAIIGTKYGAGDGVNTFNLPNLKGQTPIGKDAAQTEFAALNQKGGEKAHLLTTAEMPSHTHTFPGGSVPVITPSPTQYYWNAPTGPQRIDATGATNPTGGGAAHNILQPYTVVNFIIKVTNGDTPGDSQLTQRVSTVESWMGQTPAGTVTIWGGDTAPTNWLLCDGSAISRTTYASLFAVIGTKYGVGDGSTTFNLPNFKGKVPAGLDVSQTEFNALGLTGGTKTHRHYHASPIGKSSAIFYVINPTDPAMDMFGGSYDYNYVGNPVSIGDAASQRTAALEIHRVSSSLEGTLPPYLTVNYIIKYTNGDTQGDSQLTTRVSDLESGVSASVKLRDKMRRLQQVLTGGGIRKVDVNKGVSWGQRFITLGSDMDSLSPGGYFSIDMPPNGTVIPVYSKTALTSLTVANGFIPMDDWGALYYDLPIGGSSTSDPSRFKYVSYVNDTGHRIPPSWVLIAVRKLDADSPLITWGDGVRQDYWKNLGLLNSWYYYSGATPTSTDYAPMAWRWTHEGKVALKGLIAGGTLAQISSVPNAGGDQRAIFYQPANAGLLRIDVLYDGSITAMAYMAGGSNGYVSLEGMEWFPHS